MKDQADRGQQRSLSSAAQLVSLCADISPSSSHFFEVLYVGKIRITHRKVPESFIDDALDKFRVHDLDRGSHHGQLQHQNSNSSVDDIRRSSIESTVSHDGSVTSETPGNSAATPGEEPSTTPTRHPDEHNRTMVLQVGRNDLRLISPDRKLVLLHKQHRDVASCVQGLRDQDHFGFICREPHPSTPNSGASTPISTASSANTYIGYVFKCESPSVASDAVNAVSQAFTNPDNSKSNVSSRPQLTTCDHCPMVWYHRLCVEVENLSDRKTQAAIFRRIDQLDDDEQNIIIMKFKGAETDSTREQNEFLMMLLRAHCEMKQNRHVHDTAEQRSEFLHQYLGGSVGGVGSGIFTKAKRSLSSSFDHLLKRKGSKDDVPAATRSDLSLPVHSAQTPDKSRGFSPEAAVMNPTVRSPMMDMFMKVGSSGSPRVSISEDGSSVTEVHQTPGGSFRQAIFNRVSTPAKGAVAAAVAEHAAKGTKQQRSKEELRELWKRAIKQAVLLVRMEKENARLKAQQEETAVKRIKLEYDDLCGDSGADNTEMWDTMLSTTPGGGRSHHSLDERVLQQAVLTGVPKTKRGELWQLLADRQTSRSAPCTHPNFNTPYEELLRQLTTHQHAILIDLGRTFPQHDYFAPPLGPGQLSLFNILKAYSLLDPEVGYCQGLSFVAGVLLLHADEAEAYKLLKHLMFVRGLRAHYLPDMEALQVQLYQLSRLLHDRLPKLYTHLDDDDVSPTLYAAPWLLTMFASQFPLGFVARVLDLVFLEGADVLLRVGLALLAEHSDELLACDGFERIMEHLKTDLPACGAKGLDAVIRRTCQQPEAQVVGKQLQEYRVEYQVLREEAAGAKAQQEALSKLEIDCATLRDHNAQLSQQLELALGNVQRLERNRILQQSAHNRLEMQARTLEVTVATLGAFIDQLIESKIDIEIPGDVRRIVSQLSVAERRRTGTTLFGQRSDAGLMPARPPQMVKSLSTGRIATPISSLSHANAENGMSRSNSLSSGEINKLPALRVLAEEEKAAAASASKPTSLGSKMSHFFSTSHSHILHNKLSGAPSHTNSVKQIIREDSRENILSTPPPSEHPDDGKPTFPDTTANTTTSVITTPVTTTSETSLATISETPQITMETPQTTPTAVDSPTGSEDSGVGTPLSPKHPLSNCDVNFTFNGTTKLKNIRTLNRNLSRNSSPDLLGK